MSFQFVENGTNLKTEHARVPEIVAGFEIARGRLQVWFFDKSGHSQAITLIQGLARFEIAEAGLGMGGLDAEGNHPAIVRKLYCLKYCLFESCLILDQMISCKHQHVCICTVYVA